LTEIQKPVRSVEGFFHQYAVRRAVIRVKKKHSLADARRAATRLQKQAITGYRKKKFPQAPSPCGYMFFPSALLLPSLPF